MARDIRCPNCGSYKAQYKGHGRYRCKNKRCRMLYLAPYEGENDKRRPTGR